MPKKKKSPLDAYNEAVRAGRELILIQLLAIRPHWSKEKLIAQWEGNVKLGELLMECRKQDEANAKFSA